MYVQAYNNSCVMNNVRQFLSENYLQLIGTHILRPLFQERLVEIGRVAYIAYGEDKGKLCVIVDVIDQNRVWLQLFNYLQNIYKVNIK